MKALISPSSGLAVEVVVADTTVLGSHPRERIRRDQQATFIMIKRKVWLLLALGRGLGSTFTCPIRSAHSGPTRAL